MLLSGAGTGAGVDRLHNIGVGSVKYEKKKTFHLYSSFWTFFSRIRIFRIGSGFLADTDPGSG